MMTMVADATIVRFPAVHMGYTLYKSVSSFKVPFNLSTDMFIQTL